jgi:phospholipid/cholesterol/gamma-HCH transport system substrate-binding protein
MEGKSAAKVGSVVLVALVLFVVLYLALAHLNPNSYSINVRFDDTQGLLRQSVVQMQGVTIGNVKSIELNTSGLPPFKPMVRLSIDNHYHIPVGSRFIIVSGLLIQNPHVEVTPARNSAFLPENSDQVVEGAPSTGPLQSLSPDLQQLVSKINSSFDEMTDKLNKAYFKIDKILDRTDILLANTNGAVKSVRGLVGDPRLKDSLLVSAENLRAVTSDARLRAGQITRDLQKLVASGQGKFDKLSNNVLDLLTKIGNTVDEADTVVAKLTEQVTDPRLQQSLQETAELARTTLARFNQIASDIHQLTGDPQLQNDLKATVANLRSATEQGQQAVSKVNTILDNVAGPSSKIHKLRFPKTELIGNVSEQFGPTHLRVDMDARLGLGSRSLLDLGFYDLGQDTRLNLQAGSRLTNTVVARYGLYASRLGIGLDWYPLPGEGLRADLWDTNHPRLDVRGLFRVNSDASIWIGADSLFRRTIPLIGVQLRN